MLVVVVCRSHLSRVPFPARQPRKVRSPTEFWQKVLSTKGGLDETAALPQLGAEGFFDPRDF
jgi:hypothetical protein